MREIIVDSFAGGGGASTGIEIATGRSPHIAINHDAVALSVHAANHPMTKHLAHNIWKVDPIVACGGQPVGLLWASPDCKHFSKAKGGKPVNKNIRDLAWVVVRWAHQVAPRVIILENVEEFAEWGPVLENGRPCPERKGLHFRRFVAELQREGYAVDWKELRASDYGSPTVRKRLFMIARRDGLPIIWPKETHGAGRIPHRTAAEIIDWSLPCPSIFDTSKQIWDKHGIRAIRPLARNTMARIARGIKRYVLDTTAPFIVPITHTGDARVHGINEPLRTVTTAHRGEHALIAPTLINTRNGERKGQEPRVRNIKEPHATVTAQGSQGALVAAFLAKHFGGHETPGWDMRQPVSTVTTQDHHAVVSAGIVNLKGADRRQSAPNGACPTQTAGGFHIAEVRAFLYKFYGTEQDPKLREPLHTQTTKDRFGLVTVNIGGEPYAIVDIGMRMLTPRELFRAQGFADSYIIDRGAKGESITKTDQIRLCGNSVCPQVAAALVAANYSEMEVSESGVPEFAFIAAE